MPSSTTTYYNVLVADTYSLKFPALGTPATQPRSSRSAVPPATSSNLRVSRSRQRNAVARSEIHRTPRANRTSVPMTPGLLGPPIQLSIDNESIPQISDMQVHESEVQASELEIPKPSTEAPTLFNVFASPFVPSTIRTQACQNYERQIALPKRSRQRLSAEEPTPQPSGAQVQQSRQQTPEPDVLESSTEVSTVPTSQPAPSSDQTTANNANSVERAVKPKIFQTFQITNQRRHEFKLGGILGVTIHAVNTNPELSSDDAFVSQTKLGLVFSKSRPVIVLRRFRKHMNACQRLLTVAEVPRTCRRWRRRSIFPW
jgi:hypothetical protein